MSASIIVFRSKAQWLFYLVNVKLGHFCACVLRARVSVCVSRDAIFSL